MKNLIFYAGFIIVLLSEIAALIVFSVQNENFTFDTVAVNEAAFTVTRDFDNLENHVNETRLNYSVLDKDGNILYMTEKGVSATVNEAIAHGDVILDIKKDNETVGKILIFNENAKKSERQKNTVTAVIAAAIFSELLICLGYAMYLNVTTVKPFRKLKEFAQRIAGGNLDIPLEMDRHNTFGAFSESFDIMRSELKKARIAETNATRSKKELVAKLSHDIKTPVASIKALSDLGLAQSNDEKQKEKFKKIIGKADQINSLISNLFSATLEELQQLTVNPVNVESPKIKFLLENSDYLHRAKIPHIPECLLFADPLRLQQVFDNIFANSYKYANTEIKVDATLFESFLQITVEDFGGGVADEELQIIKEKFKRGSNSLNSEGAGLGLYISDCFMQSMHGALEVLNGDSGLKVIISVLLSGKNI